MSEKEKLIQMIQENDSILRYKKIEKLLNDNKEIKQKMNQLKSIQKQLVNAKHIEKKEAITAFQRQYDALLEEIENYPLMSEYLALQSDINFMVQSIKDIIEEGLEKDLEE